MTPEKKKNRRLRNLVILSLLLLLVGGTYAFTAFNQRAINDRENNVQVNVGGRVHDYYNIEEENKDVFVENYGERPIMARIRLSEFLEYQRGEGDFRQIAGGERDELDTWIPYIPSATNIGTRTGDGAALNRYSNLRFGRAGEAPWYLPTFNHNNLDLTTAAAGDARDLDGDSPDVTHPGDGTDGYWAEGVTYENGVTTAGTTWHGAEAGVTRETAQNLQQQRAPMTIQQWEHLPNNQKIGDFWVMDHNTGWTYWASTLEVGEATSYLLDAAEMAAAIEDTVFNGSYYYGIHVDSQLISLDNSDSFLETDSEGEHSDLLEYFLEGIKNNAFGNGNPAYNVDSQPEDFRFHLMNPGRIFTMAGEQYRYLENMGEGNHLIIRNNAIPNATWNDVEDRLTSWYGQLEGSVQTIVQPVANSFTTGVVSDVSVNFTGGPRWLPTNLEGEVAADLTQVVPGGTARAFALSLADVTHLSGEGLGFPTSAQRGSSALGWWWLRTPAPGSYAWRVDSVGFVHGNANRGAHNNGGGVRPALIIQQSIN